MAVMKAWVVPEKGEKLQLVERELPEPGAGEVRIAVHACGVCHSDAIIVEGQMPGLSWPRIPGHEVIGTIDSLGAGVAGLRVGQRVGVGWNSGWCGHCAHCKRGRFFACATTGDPTGIYRDGGYATHMIARATAAAAVPDGLDPVQSAPLLCAGITTFNALRHCGAGPGDLVAVLGVGGLGHLAIQYARAMGFHVVAINRGPEKESLARELGAHAYIDSKAGKASEALLAMGGAKAVLATVTNGEAMADIALGLGVQGKLMMIGAVGPIEIQPLDLLAKNAAAEGWYSGVAADSEDTLAFSKLAEIGSMNEVFAFADAQAAYDRMISGEARFRVVIDVNGE